MLCGLGEKAEKQLSSEFRMTCGYTNGARVYLPDREEYERGGYDVDSYLFELLPSPLSPEMENIITMTAAELDRKLNRN